jgi:hypothetical protein
MNNRIRKKDNSDMTAAKTINIFDLFSNLLYIFDSASEKNMKF